MTKVQSCHLSLLFVILVNIAAAYATRIIGGQEVQPYSIKYQASLRYNNYHFCGGTLIHPQWVVSAAHCWKPSYLLKVVVSEHNLLIIAGFEQQFNVIKVIVNALYNYVTFDNDIMMLKLERPVRLNSMVAPAVLPGPSTPQLTDATTCTVSGWGITDLGSYTLSPVLRAVDVDIISSCGYYYFFRITKNMVCAGSKYGGKDSCQGDSGGPLVCKGNLEGIVSWGISCANAYYPGVYTKVRNYVPWINWLIQND